MVVGDTATITLVEKQPAARTATVATIVITRPDAIVEQAPPLVTAAPGATPALTQTLTAYYTPAIAGGHVFLWSFYNGAATIERRRVVWAYWSDVPTAVRDLLQVDESELPDEMLDREFNQVYRLLYSRFPYLGGYYQLSLDDQASIDEALTYMLAVNLFPVKSLGAEGALTRFKAGTFEFQYGNNIQDERKAWTERIALVLGYVPSIAAKRAAAAATWNPYMISGPSRTAESAGVLPGLLDIVLNMYEDKSTQSLIASGGS